MACIFTVKKKSIKRFSNNLPEDLLAEILALQPVVSLLHSECLQRSWYSVIANSSFIFKQLRNQIRFSSLCSSLAAPALLFLEWIKLSCTSFLLITKEEISHGQDHVPVVEKIIDLTFYKITRFPQLVIVGHRYGIKCLALPSGEVILAFAAMREFRELTEPLHCPFYWLCICIGCGYATKSNDYKVVCVLFIPDYADPACPPIKAEVHTLNTDS